MNNEVDIHYRTAKPNDWETRSVLSLGKFIQGTGFPEDYQGIKSEKYPFYKVSDFNLERNTKFLREHTNSVSEKVRRILGASIIPKDTVVFAKVGAALLLNRRRITLRKSIVDNNCAGLVPKQDVNIEFLYQTMCNINFRNYVQDGAVPSINQLVLDKIRIYISKSPKEQKKIATILQTIDKTIDQTKNLIEKHKKMKEGLMKDLFLVGQTDLDLVDSELGKIPKHWQVKKIIDAAKNKQDAVQTGPFGAQLHSYDYVDEGVPLILIRNIMDGKIVDKDIPFITQKKADSLPRYWIKEGDIVFSRVADVGRAAVANHTQEGWLISGQMLRVRLNNPEINNTFLKYLIATNGFQKALQFKLLGSTRDSINTTILENLPITIPPKKEQEKIETVLSEVDSTIITNYEYLQKLQKMKSGLMQDLLTGKVRVAA
jgi:restriction endonuclease S subunit